MKLTFHADDPQHLTALGETYNYIITGGNNWNIRQTQYHPEQDTTILYKSTWTTNLDLAIQLAQEWENIGSRNLHHNGYLSRLRDAARRTRSTRQALAQRKPPPQNT